MKRRAFLFSSISAVGLGISLYPARKSGIINFLSEPLIIKEESKAAIILMNTDSPTKKAGEWFKDEITERSGIKLPIINFLDSKSADGIKIMLGQHKDFPEVYTSLIASPGNDGFQILRDRNKLIVIGNNSSGLLSGVGRLLLRNNFEKGKIEFKNSNIYDKPKFAVRGHLLAHRPNSTCYYWWDLAAWEKYIRYLLLWGVNTVGIVPGNFSSSATDGIDPWNIPAGTPADKISTAKRYWVITADVADLIHHYGLNIEGWVVANDIFESDYKKEYDMGGGNEVCPNLPDARKLILKLHKEAYGSIPYLNTLFIAGGDPGGCPCKMCTPWAKTFLPLTKDIAGVYRESHPDGKLWLSPQFYDDPESYNFFFDYMKNEKPKWVDGAVYGPNTNLTIEEFRKRLNSNYPVILYPDINHIQSCQYPMNQIDIRFKIIYSREPPNYRPDDMKVIHQTTAAYSIGSSTYSEGVHDDLNKAVWSSLDWNPKVNVKKVVEDYSRWCFGNAVTDEITNAIFGLEKNWEAPMANNKNISLTLKSLEDAGRKNPALKNNWRYQMALIRGMIDRYLQIRRDHEIEVENHATKILGNNFDISSIKKAAGYVKSEIEKQVASELRKSIDELKTVLEDGTPHGRGLHLTFFWRLDVEIGDLWWLEHQLNLAAKISDDQKRFDAVNEIINYEDPGPGGYYDEVGDPARQPHLAKGELIEILRDKPEWPVSTRFSQLTFAIDKKEVLFDYSGLEPAQNYKVRLTYFTTDRYQGSVELYASDKRSGREYKIHDSIPLPINKAEQHVFSLPKESYSSGTMELRFKRGETGYYAAVSEIWIMRA